MSNVKAISLCMVLSLLQSVFGATLHGEKTTKTMRREPHRSGVRVGFYGEMLQSSEQKVATSNPDFCAYDFPLGKESTKAECNGPSDNHIILSEEMCINAGQLAGASTSHDSFSLNHWDFDGHPKGCFYMKGCSEDSHGNCYFFNGVGSMPSGSEIAGTPVCSRPKYKNGTIGILAVNKTIAAPAGTNGTESLLVARTSAPTTAAPTTAAATTAAPTTAAPTTAAPTTASPTTASHCAEGYGVIMHEETCSAAAQCMDYCQGTNFRIGQKNASKHMEFPEGCFIFKEDKHNVHPDMEHGCVYFNSPSALGAPTRPSGTPICNVTSVTSFSASVTAAVVTTAAPATNATATATATTAVPATTAATATTAASATTVAPATTAAPR